MNYRFLFASIKNILTTPRNYWNTTLSEPASTKLIRNSLLFPLVLLVTLAGITGSAVFVNTEMPLLYSVFHGVKTFILLIAVIYSTSFILKEITYPLDLGRDFSTAFRLVTFSMVPFLLCSIVSSAFESLLFLNILGLYGLYVFWSGANAILNPPQHKRMPLLIAATIVMTGFYLALDFFFTMLTDRVFYAFFD